MVLPRRLQTLVLGALLLAVSAAATPSPATEALSPGRVHSAAIITTDDELRSSSGGSGEDDDTAGNGGSATPPPATKAPAKTTKMLAKTKASAWKMQPVMVVHARVQADEPLWDDDHQVYVSKFGSTFEEKHRGALDTVNTASVEGALMYVQAEGINVNEQSVKCERKNNMEYVVFYEFQIAQTTNSIAQYQAYSPTIEYCPFVAMDVSRCTPTDGEKLPAACYQYNGLNNEPNLGPCVGGESKESDFRAPYPNTYWFSFPSSCPGTTRNDKTDTCRAKQPGGLCPFGTAPDGVACTFAYKILGYLKIDDLVGITALTNKKTGKKYASYKEFCQAGGVEFDAENEQGSQKLTVNSALPFWKDPTNPKANQARFQKMVAMYNKLVNQNAGKSMNALPSVAQLREANPPCYMNNIQCASSKYGCKRVNYYQICELCEGEVDAACVKAPEGFSFPKLTVDSSFKLKPSGASGSSNFVNASSSSSDGSEEDDGASVDALQVLDNGSSDLTIEDAAVPTPSPKAALSTNAQLTSAASSSVVQGTSTLVLLLLALLFH
ncbi:hypothetical protein FI667_g9180, partial [Globisporangium splendens]